MQHRLAQSSVRGRAAAARRGTATLEFAIIVPFLVLVSMAMIEVTRAVQVKDVLTDAVRSGCRLAIQPGTSNATIQANVNQIVGNAGISTSRITTTIQVNGKTVDASTAVKGDQISVKVSVPVDSVGWVTPQIFTKQSIDSEVLVMLRQG
jgi:Flp pilus assembly protein TadG